MEHSITFVGLDVHKVSISVALAEGGDRGEARVYGEIANRPDALRKLLSRLAHDSRELRFCYEAGPCGYGIQRQLTDAGHNCVVVAPALIPRKPGDRIKTNRRDALKLARLHRAGELTSVWVPDPAHEAMRDLVRARLAAVRALRHARQQLSGFLLRQGRHYSRTAWGPMHRRWLAGLHFEQAAHHVVLEDMIATVEAATARRDRLTQEIEARLDDWSLAPVVPGCAGASRHGAGQCCDRDRRAGRSHPLRQSEAADGLSRSGALGAFQWRPPTSGGDHQSRQQSSTPYVGGGRLVLSLCAPCQS